LPRVFGELKNVHCIFAGKIEPGAEDKMAECLNACIENGIAERVHFLGGRADVPDILAALDVFVFSSLHEGLPVAVSEAMLAGVPMIVSDIAPLLEASGDGEYAEVFAVGDDGELAAKLITLLGDQAARESLAERAKRFAFDNFSIDAHLQGLVRLYGEL
jgi:L-malate glycosyltransferase